MQVGAVGGAGAVDFKPYIYNTNQLDRASMNKVQAIPDDVTTAKTDYSGLTESEEENINPLRRGESSNFMDIIQRQMQMGQYNASRIMRPAEEATDTENELEAVEGMDAATADMPEESMDALEDFSVNDPVDEEVQDQARITAEANNVSDVTSGLNAANIVQGVPEEAAMDEEDNAQTQRATQLDEMFSRFQMRRATDAYAFSMGM